MSGTVEGALARTQGDPGLVRKIMQVAVKKIDAENGVITFLGTTPTRDRWGEIVEPQGVVLDNYLKNPVFLWAHDYRLMPVGRAIDVRVTPAGIEFDIKFDLADPFAAQVYRKYKDGFLRATSIGFIPLEWEDFMDSQGPGRRYKKWELLELSAVPVPANPDALQMALKKAADLVEFYSMVTKDVYGGEGQDAGAVAKSVVRFEATPKAPEDRPWDADAAEQRVRKWASSDGSGDKDTIDWAKYRRAFAWYDPDNEENFGAYKLPHHDIIDGQLVVVWRGVAAAMAALLGARGGVDVPEGDRRGIYNHLAKHYEQFDKEPPEFKSTDEILLAYATGEIGTENRSGEPEPVEKAGAVLNRRNKEKLTQARDLIQEVLDSAEPATEEDQNKVADGAASNLPATAATQQRTNQNEPADLIKAIAEYAAIAAKREVERLLGRA